jgi:hypothetical protein
MLVICRQQATKLMTHTLLRLKATCMCGMAQHGLMLVKLLDHKDQQAHKDQLARQDHRASKAFKVMSDLLAQLERKV